MEISTCVKYVGVNDHQVDLFEGQYKVPNGMMVSWSLDSTACILFMLPWCIGRRL